MPEYTLRIRRYSPESGEAAHWQDFNIDLDGHRSVLDGAKRSGVGTIISFHDLDNTPQLGSLRAKAERASELRGTIFKVATRTDSPIQLARLMEFVSVTAPRLPISAPARWHLRCF